jgi:hypothetical protein
MATDRQAVTGLGMRTRPHAFVPFFGNLALKVSTTVLISASRNSRTQYCLPTGQVCPINPEFSNHVGASVL